MCNVLALALVFLISKNKENITKFVLERTKHCLKKIKTKQKIKRFWFRHIFYLTMT